MLHRPQVPRSRRPCSGLLGIAASLALLSSCEPDDELQRDAASAYDAAPSDLASRDASAQSPSGGGSFPDAGGGGVSASSDAASADAASAGDNRDGAAAATDAAAVPVGMSDAASNGRTDASGFGAPRFHVFLLLGQSNMAGYPKAQPADKVEDPRVRVLGYDECAATGRHKDVWDTAAPPLHECWNGAIGPGDYFAKTLLNAIPQADTIGLVPCAISGERIEAFLKAGGAKYASIVSRGKLAQEAGGVIEGILFHQGESNCTDPAWPDKVKTLVSDLRRDLGLGDAPFLAGELAPNGRCASHNPLVNQLASSIPNAHVVSAQGLVIDPADTQWQLHFDHDSQVTFGKRYAQVLIDALDW